MPLNPRDRGLAYGDGVFETVRVAASGEVPLCGRATVRAWWPGYTRWILRYPINPDSMLL